MSTGWHQKWCHGDSTIHTVLKSLLLTRMQKVKDQDHTRLKIDLVADTSFSTPMWRHVAFLVILKLKQSKYLP